MFLNVPILTDISLTEILDGDFIIIPVSLSQVENRAVESESESVK